MGNVLHVLMTSPPPVKPAHAFSTVTVPSPAEFDDIITKTTAAAAPANGRVYVLVTGDRDAATGKSWCPGCALWEPFVLTALDTIAESETERQVTLVLCPVVKEDYKGNPAYPYRTHALLKLTEVPTLYRWGVSGPLGTGPLKARSLESLELIERLGEE